MRDSQALSVVNGLVQKISAHHGSMGGAISMMIVAIVAWVALKEVFGMALSVFERLG